MSKMVDTNVRMIPVNLIKILNPRNRNQAVFQSIVANISTIGLKKPITVAEREEDPEGKRYDLVCGQGRLEAFIALGQTEVPAIIKNATKDECFLMSLVENIARRNLTTVELLREIQTLKSRGYTPAQIATKIDMAKSYIMGVTHLLDHGEERLLMAVEKGRIPLSVAMQIASADDGNMQKILCDAYEGKTLRGKKLQAVRRLVEQRRIHGKHFRPGKSTLSRHPASAETLVRVYRREAGRQKLLVKKARLTESRLVFVVSATKKLFEDENFVTLLRAEGLDSLPTYLALRIQMPVGA
jgi:ParB family chromosome partitioning protein